MVGDVGGGNGAEVHMGGRLVFSDNPKEDNLPGVWSGTHCGFHDGTTPPHAQEGALNILKPAAGQSDGTPTPGIRCDIPTVNKAMTLPLPWLPGVLTYMEWIALVLQQAALGG